jgi:putative membrane protein
LAILTGFMLGSLNKIWPWRNVLSYRTNSRGEQVPFLEENVLPAQYDGEAMIAGVIICALVGFAAVFLLEKLGGEEAKQKA